MYVHLGGDLVVAMKDVVAILDVRLLQTSELTREFVDRAMGTGRLLGDGLTPDCKALVVTAAAIFTSGISPSTLARRMTHFRQSAIEWGAET